VNAMTKGTLLLALAAAGCGTEPSTGVPGDPAVAEPLIFYTGYTASALPLTPQGMNDSGSMAGITPTGAPALYSGGTLTTLGTTPADGCIRYSKLQPTPTNGVVGDCDTSMGTHPVYWFFLAWGPAHLPLQVGYSAVPSATVTGSTTGYSMVGTASGGPFTFGVAYRWSGPGATSLTSLQPVAIGTRTNYAYASSAIGMNDAGYAAGLVYTGMDTYPVVWSPSNAFTILQGLGSYANYQTRPTVVKSGAIAGISGTSPATGWYAMLWNLNGTLANYVPMANLASVDGLSTQGRLAGKAYTGSGYRAWTWYAGALTWLDPPAGAAYLQPVGVDSCGRIAAQAVTSSGTATGVLLSKLFCDTTVVLAQ